MFILVYKDIVLLTFKVKGDLMWIYSSPSNDFLIKFAI